MATDPFQWAANYARDANAAGARDSSYAQQSLLTMFQEEAARQRPYSSLPVDLAKQRSQYALADQNNANSDVRRQRYGAEKDRLGAMNVAPNKIREMIYSTARTYGIDPLAFMTLFELENAGFDPQAVSPTGATGMGQFTTRTAKRFGLITADGTDNRMNAALNIDATARYWAANESELKDMGVTNIDPPMLYMAHQQGAGGEPCTT